MSADTPRCAPLPSPNEFDTLAAPLATGEHIPVEYWPPRAHKPACGLQQPRGPTRVPTCACAVCEDECAGDRTAAAGASRRGSEPMGAGRRWRAVGAALGELKRHL